MRRRKSKSQFKIHQISTIILVLIALFVPFQDFDDDSLSTYNEYLIHKTDPFNPDSDFDQLLDGKEVLLHLSNPNLMILMEMD